MVIVSDLNNQSSSSILGRSKNQFLANKTKNFFRSGSFKQGLKGMADVGVTSSMSASVPTSTPVQAPAPAVTSTLVPATAPVVTNSASVSQTHLSVPPDNISPNDQVQVDENKQLDTLDKVLSDVEASRRADLQAKAQIVAPTPALAPTPAQAPAPTSSSAQTPISTPIPVESPVQAEPPQVSADALVGQNLNQVLEDQTNANLNPSGAAGTTKERAQGSQEQAVEAAQGIQIAETEPTPEISPDIEAYLKKVNQQGGQPQEIIIADDISQVPDTTTHPSKPVIVLPISPEIEKKAKFKSPKFSIKWLVEWSRKIMKIFAGEVIYRQPDNAQQ